MTDTKHESAPAEKVCKCVPCADCGYKHYCNLMVDHKVEPRTGYCPGLGR